MAIIPLAIVPCESTDPWEDWGVVEGEEYEFILTTCTRFGSTFGTNLSLYTTSNLVAIQGDHWTVTIVEVNSSGLYQTITKDGITTPVHEYSIAKSWFWGQAGNVTYWQELVDFYNAEDYTENNPDLYTLDEWTLSEGIYTEHREYKNSAMELKKFSIHIGKGVTTIYELKYNETSSGADYLSIHHLKFTLVTDLGDDSTSNNNGGDGPIGSDNILAPIINFITDNPELTLLIG